MFSGFFSLIYNDYIYIYVYIYNISKNIDIYIYNIYDIVT